MTKVINVGKKQPYYYFVGKIVSSNSDCQHVFLVSLLKLKPIVFHDMKDEASVNISDNVLKLQNYIIKKGTSRTAFLLNFKINLHLTTFQCKYETSDH